MPTYVDFNNDFFESLNHHLSVAAFDIRTGQSDKLLFLSKLGRLMCPVNNEYHIQIFSNCNRARV